MFHALFSPGVDNVGMGRLLLRLLIVSLALWVVTLILQGHVDIKPFAPGGTFELIVTIVLVALVFGIVNAVVGGVVRVVAFPLYVLTLGLISLVVNGLLLLLVAWLSSLAGFGLTVGGFWWGVLGALLLGIISWLIGILLRPLTGTQKRR